MDKNKGGMGSSDQRYQPRRTGHARAPWSQGHYPHLCQADVLLQQQDSWASCQEQFVLFLGYLRPCTEWMDKWFNFPGPDEHPLYRHSRMSLKWAERLLISDSANPIAPSCVAFHDVPKKNKWTLIWGSPIKPVQLITTLLTPCSSSPGPPSRAGLRLPGFPAQLLPERGHNPADKKVF